LGVRQIHARILPRFSADPTTDLETQSSFFSNMTDTFGRNNGQMQTSRSALSPQESAVYSVLKANRGRVVSRFHLAREADLTGLSERRCDALISAIRSQIGSERIVTVRRRGWMLTN
jgi:DNA-binding response OmpR family regulator